MMWKDKGRISRYWSGSGSFCNFSTLCIVIFHVTISQQILVPMPQLILIQQAYSVPSRTHYVCDISRFPHRPWSIISCVHRCDRSCPPSYITRSTKAFDDLMRESLSELARALCQTGLGEGRNFQAPWAGSIYAVLSSIPLLLLSTPWISPTILLREFWGTPLLPRNISLKLCQLLQRQQGCLAGFLRRKLMCHYTSIHSCGR